MRIRFILARPVSTMLAVLALGIFAVPILAQQPVPPADPSKSQKERPPADPAASPATKTDGTSNRKTATVLYNRDEDYRIGITDTLDIRVVDAEELSGQRRVTTDGTIKLPFLGRIVAVDKTTEQLATEIAKGLQPTYLFDARVSVDVLEYNSRQIFVQGAVMKPGIVSAEGRPDLLQVIAISGGLLPNHGSTAFVIRRRKLSPEQLKQRDAELRQEQAEVVSDPDQPRLKDAEWLSRQYQMIRLKIAGLYRGNFDQNMSLEPNDIVTIPPTDLFFVSGAVKAPGSFPLKDGTTLRQALALAQGLTSHANAGKTLIFRENPETGTRKEMSVDAGKIMSGKQEDVIIYQNDVIIVPNSQWKQIVYPLMNVMAYSVVTSLLLAAIY